MPLYSPDLKGLAPLLIQIGAAETLLDDALALAKAAGRRTFISICKSGPR
jgi:acetyl esterase/lipase